MDATLPDWLAPDESQRRSTRVERELERTRFDHAFEFVLNRMAGGQLFARALRDYPIALDYGRFSRWIRKDPARWNEYCEAQQCGGELMAATVADSQLNDEREIPLDANERRVDFEIAKWYLGVIDRKRFQPAQQIEINQNISIVAALAAANGRLIEHEQARLLTDGSTD